MTGLPDGDAEKIILEASLTGKMPEFMQTLQDKGRRFFDDELLHKVFDKSRQWAKHIVEDHGELTMMFVVHGWHHDTEERSQTPILIDAWPPPEEINGQAFGKSGAMQALGLDFALDHPGVMPIALVQMSEAWMVQYDKDVDVANLPTPSEDPHRVEAVITTITTMDRRYMAATDVMQRGPDGKLTGFKSGKIMRFDKDSEFVNYLADDFYRGYFLKR
jgi:hypothetical protein